MHGRAGGARQGRGCCSLPRARPRGAETWAGSGRRACPAWGGGLWATVLSPQASPHTPWAPEAPTRSRAGLQFNPRGNSLPGRPREGRSGAARPPGTPRTPRACRLRVGAGRKNPAWVDTCSAPGPQPSACRATSRDTGVPVCWFHGASWRRSCGPLVVLFARMSPALAVTGPLRPPCAGGVGGTAAWSQGPGPVLWCGSGLPGVRHFSSQGPCGQSRDDVFHVDCLVFFVGLVWVMSRELSVHGKRGPFPSFSGTLALLTRAQRALASVLGPEVRAAPGRAGHRAPPRGRS